MNKVLIVHLAAGLGLHFFDWSLNFLANNKVVDNPLSNGRAHKHEIKVVQSPDDLNRYPSNNADILVLHSVCSISSVDPNAPTDLHSHEGRERLKIKMLDTHAKIIQTALNQGFRIAVVDWSKQHWLIPSYQKRFNKLFFTDESATREQQNAQWIKLFFFDAQEKWDQKSVWDQRELLAVCMRPKTMAETFAKDIHAQFDKGVDYITTDRLWFDLDSVVSEYVTVNTDKMQHWLSVYHQWQCVHDVKFSLDYNQICQDIATGTHRDLSEYDLDFTKEALIQHAMIYAYDLNFKTWNLERFPNSAIDLHNLLEPNIHQRQFTYQDL